jgi:lactate dehydrogenase-like 2-hydroxyacid dehydrogenase
MTKKKILVPFNLFRESLSELTERYDVVFPEGKAITKEEALPILHHFDAILPPFAFKVDKDVIDAAANLKIVANFGVGYDNIDVKYATEKGIVVTNTPDPVIEPTAEMAFSLMLCAARRISEMDRKMRHPGEIKIRVMGNLGVGLYGKTLGIIGMGRIGQALARRASASGMNIIYHNRSRLPLDVEMKYEARHVSLDELLRLSDFISLNAPATPETKHLISDEELTMMKSSAILVNTARGSLVDEEALVNALQNNIIRAAGLDVFENEPNVHPSLLTLDNVILSPHNGTGTVDARMEMGRFAAQNIIRFFEGRNDITRVN